VGFRNFIFAGAEPHLDRLLVKLSNTRQVFCLTSSLSRSTAGTISKRPPVATKQNAPAPKRLTTYARGPEFLFKN